MARRGTRIMVHFVHAYYDRHGKLRHYYRRVGRPRVALPEPGSPGFVAAYERAAAAVHMMEKRGEEGTFDRLVQEFLVSAEFRKLKPSTQTVYRRIYENFAREHGHRRVDQMQRKHVDSLLAGMADRPGAANSFLKRLKTLMAFAIEHEYTRIDPTYRKKGFKAGTIHTWSEEQIAQFEAHWPVGSKQRLAFALHLYTGQRRSDVHRMTWADYDGETIKVTQQKTGARLEIPVHPALKQILETTQRRHLVVLTTEYGKPFSVAGYGAWLNGAIRTAGLPAECVAHGLRKAAARRLAEAGCSAHEIMSVTGHATLAEVERYTKAVDQKTLSRSAMAKQKAHSKG